MSSILCQCPQCNAFRARGRAERRLQERAEMYARFDQEVQAELQQRGLTARPPNPVPLAARL